jgi:hypothetical protein
VARIWSVKTPVDEALVARDDEAGPLVATDQEPEEQAGLLAGQRQVAELIEDQDPRVGELLEDPLQAILVAGADEPPHQRLQGEEQHRVPGLDGLDAEGDGQGRLADAGRNSNILRSFLARSSSIIAGTHYSASR